jgi:hypothetical protein
MPAIRLSITGKNGKRSAMHKVDSLPALYSFSGLFAAEDKEQVARFGETEEP